MESVLVALASFFKGYGIKGLVPSPYTSACKRPCMFLRWMVRDNSPVDLGLWSTFIDKANLYIPLDTHVLQSAAKLKIMNGKPAGWKAVTSLTRHMAEAFPRDRPAPTTPSTATASQGEGYPNCGSCNQCCGK